MGGPAKIKIFEAGPAFNPAAVIRDTIEGARLHEVWTAFAWDETKQRYRRSTLGLAWILVSYLLFVIAIVLFFGGFSTSGQQFFIAYVAIGYAAFTFLSGNIIDGCEVFVVSAPWVKSATLPYSVYVFRSVARSIMPFAIQLCGALLVLTALGWPVWRGFVWLPLVFAIYILNAVALQTTLGLVAARFRDITHLTTAINRLLFFATPIMWVYSEAPSAVRSVALWNPLTHFIEILRAPLMNEAPMSVSWGAVAGVTALNWILAIVVGGAMRRRLPFWV